MREFIFIFKLILLSSTLLPLFSQTGSGRGGTPPPTLLEENLEMLYYEPLANAYIAQRSHHFLDPQGRTFSFRTYEAIDRFKKQRSPQFFKPRNMQSLKEVQYPSLGYSQASQTLVLKLGIKEWNIDLEAYHADPSAVDSYVFFEGVEGEILIKGQSENSSFWVLSNVSGWENYFWLNWQGFSAYEEGDWPLAAEYFAASLDVHPFWPHSRFNLLCTLSLMKEPWEESKEHFTFFLETKGLREEYIIKINSDPDLEFWRDSPSFQTWWENQRNE